METKEEKLEAWYQWLSRRLSDSENTNKFYIKQALIGFAESMTGESEVNYSKLNNSLFDDFIPKKD